MTPAGLGLWRVLEIEYTAVFPTEFTPDEAVTKAIRIFDPAYVPLFVRRTMQSPNGGVDAYGYHVIGRHIPAWPASEDPRIPVHLVQAPSVWPYATGTLYAQRTWSLPWRPGSWQYRACFPDLYLPHDMELHNWMRATHRFMFDEARSVIARMKDLFKAEAAAEQRTLDEAQALAKDKLHDDKHELKDAAANELHFLEHPRQNPNLAPREPQTFVFQGER